MSTLSEPLPVVRQLQEAIRASQLSLHELGRRTGVSQGQLSRFLRGDRTLTLPAAAKLCLYLGLQLTRDQNAPDTCPAPDDRKPRPTARHRT